MEKNEFGQYLSQGITNALGEKMYQRDVFGDAQLFLSSPGLIHPFTANTVQVVTIGKQYCASMILRIRNYVYLGQGERPDISQAVFSALQAGLEMQYPQVRKLELVGVSADSPDAVTTATFKTGDKKFFSSRAINGDMILATTRAVTQGVEYYLSRP